MTQTLLLSAGGARTLHLPKRRYRVIAPNDLKSEVKSCRNDSMTRAESIALSVSEKPGGQLALWQMRM